MQDIYDEDEFVTAVGDWTADVLDVEPHVKLATPKQEHAVLACDVTWGSASAVSELASDVTAMSASLKQRLGPLVRLTQFDARERKMHICMLEMPYGAYVALRAEVDRAARTFDARRKRPFRFYAFLFTAATVNLLAGALALHNHWYAYEEPWETPLEFIRYHVFGSH